VGETEELSGIAKAVADVYGAAGLDRLRTEQREKLLPQLERKRQRLCEKRDALNAEIATIEQAEADIRAGKITDYQLRVPREKEIAG